MNSKAVFTLILNRVLDRLKEDYVWTKINDEKELEALSLEYFLVRQSDNENKRREILKLVRLLTYIARDVIFNYADELALNFLEEEWKRFLEEEKR